MESLLPTEIARLIYGYLMEEDCERAARLFLETSEHLKECLLVSKKGRRFNTRVSGHNLVDILDILCEATCLVKAYSENPASKDTAENVLQQLKTLLIPEEKRKVRYMKGRNETSLPAIGINEEYNQNDVTKICETKKEKAMSENKLKPLLDFSPCKNVSFNNDTIEEKKTCNNGVEQTGEPSSSKISDATKNISNALVHQASVKVCEKKEHYKDKMIQERSSESTTATVLQIDSSHLDSSYLSVHCSENVSKADYDNEKLETDNINNSKTDATRNDITSSSSSHPSTISKNALPTLPPLPISIQHVCNPKSPVMANSLRMQLKTPSKTNLSFNQSEPIQENDHLLNLQQTLSTSYSINQPLIYIKTGAIDKNQFRPNIFTSEHRPKSSSFREILENSSSSNEKNNQGSLEGKGSHSVEAALKNNENSLSEFLYFKTMIKDDASEIIRTGVRTRGGYRKRGGKVQRTVKAHLPKTIISKENKPHLVPGIRENCDAYPSPSIIGMTVTNSADTSINPFSERIGEETKTEENTSIRKETVEKEIEEDKKKSTKDTAEKSGTPSIKNFRKRGSSSVPRRGSHIRALEFKTPIKSLLNRRSLTSPKQLQSSRSPATKKSLRCVRVTLFKSPSTKKENKTWDADLRKCFDGNTDIPSSVGLKRKSNSETVKYESPDQTKPSTLSKNSSELISSSSQLPAEAAALRNEDTNDVLADKIQKEVLSVIGEEDMNFTGDNSNLTNGLNKILFRSTNMCSTQIKSKSDTFKESINSDKKKNLNEEEIINDNPKSPEFARLNNVMDVEVSPNHSCFMTPVTKALQEHREILAHGLLTPGTPLTDINMPSTESKTKNFEGSSLKVVSSSSNLAYQDSLEASLIKECKRIETENLHNSTEQQFVPSCDESSFNTTEKLLKRADCEFKLNVLSTNDTPLRKSSSTCYCSKQQNKKNETIITCGCDSQLNSSKTTIDLKNISNDFQDVHNDNKHESTPVSMQNRPLPNNNENSKKNSIEKNNSFSEVEVFVNETCLDSKTQKVDHQQPSQVLEQSIKKMPTINSSVTASIEGNMNFPESYTISADKKSKTSLENLKSKTCPQKYDIDCSKLIAQCLQSAKENLYGWNKKMSSSRESLTQKITRERNVKLSKVKNVGNNSEKRNENSLRKKSTRELPARIKGRINSSLFSETESTSSCEDSCPSEMKDEKCGNNNSNENEDALSKVGLVNQIINCSSPQNSITDADSVDFNDVFVTKNKQNILGTNETNLEESSMKQKENVQKHLKKKTSNTLGEKLLPEQDIENETNLEHHVEVVVQEDLVDRPLESNNRTFSVDLSSENMNCHALNKKSINNLPSIVSFSKSNENVEDSPPKPHIDLVANNHKFFETLSNYTFTFALKLDGVNVTKQLSVSPFYSVMEMECTDGNSSISNNLETTERDCCTLSVSDSEKKSKKRRRDYQSEKNFSEILSNSLVEVEKSSPVKKSKRSNDYRYSDLFCARSERVKSRRYLESRIKRSPIRYLKNTYNRHFREYNTTRLRRYNTSRSRFSHSEGSNPRRGVCGSSRKERYRNDESSKRSSYRTMESSETSRRFHKDRAETKKSREDLKPRNQFKKDGGNSKTPSHYSSRSLKDKKKQTHGLDKEDGELSESSLSICSSRPVEISSPTNNQRRSTIQSSSSPVDEDTRAKLKKLNLDHFLSILHGKEK